MRYQSPFLKPFLMGIVIAAIFFTIVGAVDRQTSNVSEDTTVSFNSVFASSDGRIVYVIDNDRVYRSSDGGANWSIVLRKSDAIEK